MQKVMMIDVDHIHPHPDNPRKDIGNIEELSESIRKNGIMQNLTVIPIDGQSGEYMTLIGHRRCEASKAAGLKELPCDIAEGLTKKEQVAIMLEENMQRSDLTILEQAQGFQMMIDLGETEESIAQKTGFSKPTVKHRLNLAKLEPDLLREKEESSNYQLSLTDLYELEKIKDIEKRNQILKNSSSSRDITWRVNQELEQIKIDARKKTSVDYFVKIGVMKATDDVIKNYWKRDQYERVGTLYYRETNCEELELPEGKELYYIELYNSFAIVYKIEHSQEEIEAKSKELDIRDREKRISNDFESFTRAKIDGKIKSLADETGICQILWSLIMEDESYQTHREDIKEFLEQMFNDQNEDKEEYEDDYTITDEELDDWANRLNMTDQMMIVACQSVTNDSCISWNGMFNKEIGNKIMIFYSVLQKYGFSFKNQEDINVLDGSSPLYRKGE